MNFSNIEIQKQYEYWITNLAKENLPSTSCFICVADVLDAHFSIVDYFLEEGEGEKAVGGIGPRDLGLLISAVSRQHVSYGPKEKWRNHFEKCATLFYGLIKNHPFHDCNKRTAILTAIYYLEKINRVPTIKHKEIEILTLRTATDDLRKYPRFKNYEMQEDKNIYYLAEHFQKSSRKADKRSYIVTYQELDRILNTFECGLKNPHKNFIDVIKNEYTRGFLGFGKVKKKEIRVGCIPFPGWTREACRKDIQEVRKMTRLTDSRGYDSQVFFRGAEPLPSLINEFSWLLKRLADK